MILLDTCVWGGARNVLEQAGYNTRWIGDLDEDPGDEMIIAKAFQEKRVLITLDKDFGELAIVKGAPHYGIIRIVGYSAREQGPACLKVLSKYADELKSGAIITLEKGRVRIRTQS